jgi:hypothetical protein
MACGLRRADVRANEVFGCSASAVTVNTRLPASVTAATLVWFVLAAGPAPRARADENTFGGGEAAYSHDSNFLASPADVPATSDNSTVYSTYLGHYWPSDDLRNAFLMRGEAALVRQNTFTALDSTDYGASLGYYHAFSARNVLTASVGALARRFSDASFDSHTASLQASLKQRVSATVWLRESASVEHSSVSTSDFSYTGRTYATSATWNPARPAQISLSLSWWTRSYDGAPGAPRTGRQTGAAWVQQLGDVVYLRASLAKQRNETLDGTGYGTTIYSLGLGFGM